MFKTFYNLLLNEVIACILVRLIRTFHIKVEPEVLSLSSAKDVVIPGTD